MKFGEIMRVDVVWVKNTFTCTEGENVNLFGQVGIVPLRGALPSIYEINSKIISMEGAGMRCLFVLSRRCLFPS